MEITQTNNSIGSNIVVSGLIKSIEDSDKFKLAVASAFNSSPKSTISIYITDSFIVTSAIIGFLIKIINKDGAKISIRVGDSSLFELLQKLSLVDMLNAKLEVQKNNTQAENKH